VHEVVIGVIFKVTVNVVTGKRVGDFVVTGKGQSLEVSANCGDDSLRRDVDDVPEAAKLELRGVERRRKKGARYGVNMLDKYPVAAGVVECP